MENGIVISTGSIRFYIGKSESYKQKTLNAVKYAFKREIGPHAILLIFGVTATSLLGLP